MEKLLVVILLLAAMACAFQGTGSTSGGDTASQPVRETINGHEVLQRDGNAALLNVDGEAVWVFLLPEPDLSTPAVDWDAFDRAVG